jgi:hypothetical protein
MKNLLNKVFNKNKKLRVGIDINEILRCRWLSFDRYYAQEFGEEGAPEGNPYSYDLFNSYKFEDISKEENFLNEELPDLSAKYYQVDPETGKADIDFLAFRKQTINLTAREVFNKFMYEDFLLEIHALAPVMYKGMENDIQKFYQKYSNFVEFIIVSKENGYTIPPTLFFLSKVMFRAKKILFPTTNKELWKNVDILVTTDPELLDSVPLSKKVIKTERPYNIDSKKGFINIKQLNDLNGNKDFEKLIKYKAI